MINQILTFYELYLAVFEIFSNEDVRVWFYFVSALLLPNILIFVVKLNKIMSKIDWWLDKCY